MTVTRRTNTSLIVVIASIGALGLASIGLLVWFVMWYLPHSPRAYTLYRRRANARYERGDYSGAIEAYTSAIQTSPRNPEGYFLRAWAYYGGRSYRASLADYNQVLKYATDTATKREAHFNRGACYREMHDSAHAIPEFTASLRLGEQGADVYEYRGNAYYQQKDYPHALQDLNRAVDAEPKRISLYSSRADISMALYQYKSAVDDLSFATRLDPRNNPLRGALGWALYLDGKEDAAIQMDREVLAAGSISWVHANLGLCYAARGDWETAQPEYAMAIKQAGTPEMEGVTKDVRDALQKKPESPALKKALTMLDAELARRKLRHRGLRYH